MNGKILIALGAAVFLAAMVWFSQRQGRTGTEASAPDPEEGLSRARRLTDSDSHSAWNDCG